MFISMVKLLLSYEAEIHVAWRVLCHCILEFGGRTVWSYGLADWSIIICIHVSCIVLALVGETRTCSLA